MPKAKSATIVVAGSGDKFDVTIERGVTPRDLLEQLNLSGHLTKYGDPAPFGENEELFPRINDGEKLVLSPKTPVA